METHKNETQNPACSHIQKSKRISKPGIIMESKNSSMDDQQSQLHLNMHRRKETAKEIKRLREQNRRANHKEYVASLEQELHKKEQHIFKLQETIAELQRKIAENNHRVCQKCQAELTDTSNLSPLLLIKINSADKDASENEPIGLPTGNIFHMGSMRHEQDEQGEEEEEEEEIEIDDEFRKLGDDNSLRICFGNKNLLFFIVTMCCLTIGSIADNPETFLEPIPPYRVKSQLRHLWQYEKLSYYSRNRPLPSHMRSQQWSDIYGNLQNRVELDGDIARVSDWFRLPRIFHYWWSMAMKKGMMGTGRGMDQPKWGWGWGNLKHWAQLLMGLGSSQLAGRFLEARNYYQ